MKALLALALLAAACTSISGATPLPTLDATRAEALLLAADRARAAAFSQADVNPLRPLFAEAAIRALTPQLARLRRRGQRVETEEASHRLVHWAPGPGAGEGVLEVSGRQRVVRAGGPRSGWSRIVRQWQARLAWSGGRWLIAEAGDLPPPQWWSG